jgi:putative FmdB family regulatory protein
MPIYEYECMNCGERFELRRGMTDEDDEIGCPKCGTKKPRRIFSVFGTSPSESTSGSSGSTCAPGRFT